MPKKKTKKSIAGKKASKPKQAKKSRSSALSIKRPAVHVRKVRYVIEPVPEQFVFYLEDGTILRNLTDLINALDSMADDLFHSHANNHKNDFSNWIRDIIEEPDLSMNICGKNRIGARDEIISFLKRRAKHKG
ncbi:MAG: hypothetical protein KKE20_03480 [Nanoarchaeota archaeon]|nr:hypothetical protein [Nanoarchaeota archaeon]